MTNIQLSLLQNELSEEEQYFNYCLHNALHSFCDAAQRWENRKKRGLDDNQLKEAIAYEFGISGCSSSSKHSVHYSGGKHPKLWISESSLGKPTLQGKELIEAVRSYIGMPYPD